MKVLKSIGIILLALITFNSCEEDVDNYHEQWYVDEFKIEPNQWKLVGEPDEIGSYYECVFSGLPLHDSYYDGIVTAYMYSDYGTKHEVQAPLPYTIFYIDNVGGYEEKVSLQFSYEVRADGKIAFKAHVNDYFTSLFRPETIYFKVAIIW